VAVQISASAQNAIGLLQASSSGFHDFGTHSVNTQNNTTFTFTITNRGQEQTGPIAVGAMEGANPGDFSVVGSDCPNRQLSTNQACFVRIRFQPQPPLAPRNRSASFTVTADPGGRPQVTLFGLAAN
jgi:hypothetical protein